MFVWLLPYGDRVRVCGRGMGTGAVSASYKCVSHDPKDVERAFVLVSSARMCMYVWWHCADSDITGWQRGVVEETHAHRTHTHMSQEGSHKLIGVLSEEKTNRGRTSRGWIS